MTATFTLESITVPDKPLPPRIVIHGVHGVGKTTFAAGAPNPVVIRTEDGLGTLKVPAFPLATEYDKVLQALRALYKDEHPYRTLVLDSLDWLEPLVWQRTCLEHGKQTIEDFGYGKGYLHADEFWKELLSALNYLREKRGMTVVLIAHTEIRRYDAPDSAPYDRFAMKLHKRAAALVDEWADVVGFARYEVHVEATDVGFNKKVARGVGSGARLLCLEERPAFDAKNRYSLPAELPLDWGAFREALKQSFTAAAPPEPPAPATTTTPAEAEPSTEEPASA